MEVLGLLLYSASLIVVFLYFFLTLRRSEFGVILVGYDIFFFLGCCIYPLVLEAGFIAPGGEGISSLISIGKPGLLTAMHVFAVAFGMLLGYVFGCESGRALSMTSLSRYKSAVDFLIPHPQTAWRLAILLGITLIVVYMWIVGFDVALINAVAARAGDFEGFGEKTGWLFLKTLSIVCGLSFVFLPAVLLSRGDRPFLVLYVVLAALIYLNSPSRGLLLWLLVVPVTIWLYASGSLLKPRILIVLPLLVLLAAAILLYGKHFGVLPRTMLEGDAVTEIEAFQSDSGFGGLVGALLRNTEFHWYSISAGIAYFYNHGPLIPSDVLLAPLGFVPSRVLEWIGLGHISYGNAETKLACVNSAMFHPEYADACSIPPLYSGYSAYLAPVVGGLVLSFCRNWYFGRFESLWMKLRKERFERLWFPYLGVHLVALLFSFIPPNIAIVAFVLIVFASYGVAKSAKSLFYRRLSLGL